MTGLGPRQWQRVEMSLVRQSVGGGDPFTALERDGRDPKGDKQTR